jgi:hypothetical protein
MKYRYLRSHAQTGLGRAAALLTGENFPVVRAGDLCPENLMSTPVVGMDHPLLPLEECVRRRAIELVEKHKLICVLWSGGLDSTVTLAALLTHKTSWNTILFSTDELSQKDAPPEVYNIFMDMGGQPISLTPMTVADLIARGYVFVDGSQADIITLSDEWIGIAGLDYETTRQLSAVEMLRLRSGASDIECAVAMHHLQPLIELMPAHIPRTGLNIHWWVSFTTLWDYDLYEMPFVFSYPVEKGNCFFATDDFQRWALQDSADKMIAGDLNSKARLTQIANDLLGGRYSFVKNTTLPTTVGPSHAGMKRLHTTNFAYICEDLSYRVWSHGQ